MRRRRGLTAEDKELWSRVAKTATPMHPKARPAPDQNDQAAATAPPRIPQLTYSTPRDFTIGAKAGRGPGPDLARAEFAASPADALGAQPIRMDHKTHRQMTRGKMRPEARLDLHGMTLAEAGPELADFVLGCHARGLRLVLVITGKGSRDGDFGPLPVRRGALRHQVPHWLQSGPLARVVQQVTPAHLRHGGTGAYYVYLRR